MGVEEQTGGADCYSFLLGQQMGAESRDGLSFSRNTKTTPKTDRREGGGQQYKFKQCSRLVLRSYKKDGNIHDKKVCSLQSKKNREAIRINES